MHVKFVGAQASCAVRVVDRHSPWKRSVMSFEETNNYLLRTAHAGISCAKATEDSSPRKAHPTPKVLRNCMTVDWKE